MATDVDDNLVILGTAKGPTLLYVIDIGSTSSTARPTGVGAVYWICNNGITPANAVDGDLVYNRP